MNKLINSNSGFDNELKYLLFSLDSKKYAIEISHVVEVIKLTELEYPQKLPIFLCGLLHYNHLTINIINTPKVLGLPEKKFDIDSQILIVKTGESIFGFVVDKVFDLLSISREKVHLRPYNSSDNIIKFITYVDEEMVFIFDLHFLEKYIKSNESAYTESKICELFPTDENSLKILHERKQQLARKEDYSLSWAFTETDEYISFSINSNNFCINIGSIKEITKINKDAITKVPCAPNFITGIISYHGEFYTVIDIGCFLNNSSSVTNEQQYKLILINDSDFKIALLVTEVHNILKLFPNEIQINKYDDQTTKYFSGEFVRNSVLIRILNIKNLLSDKRLFVYENV